MMVTQDWAFGWCPLARHYCSTASHESRSICPDVNEERRSPGNQNLHPERAIEGAILNRFANVLG